tara:strand:+ start:1214 stop:1897 length:684 start_codon:yes stop_codon:yes gene_type:complete
MAVNLVVVAHPDDEVLGFGGTGSLLADNGETVQPIILCGSVEARTSRPDIVNLHNDMNTANKLLGFEKPILGEFPNLLMNTEPHLKIVKFIEEQILLFNPTRIFTHFPHDLNDDHYQISKACQVASRIFQRKSIYNNNLSSIYFMEILSSTDWSLTNSSNQFIPNTFIDIERKMKNKLEALKTYRNVMRDQPHPRSEEVLLANATYRGGQSGFKFAEAFKLIYSTKL